MVTRQFKKNAIIINQDDETDSIYFIQSGRVRVYRDDDQGHEITLNILSLGQYFGEFALLSSLPRVAHVTALENTTAIIATRKAFMSVFADNAAVAWRLGEILVEKIRAATLNVSNLALLDAYDRVSNTLIKNAREVEGRLIVENLTHQEIANLIGASHEMVSRIIKDMRLNEAVKTEDRKIIILKDLTS